MQRHPIALLSTPVLVALAACILAIIPETSCSPLLAQITSTPPSVPRTSHPGMPGPQDDPFADNPEMRYKLERSRAADRQRRIVDDANRLVTLTAQYRKSLDAHGMPNDDDQKLLMQIEKLARDVKDRMRGM